MLSVPGSVRSRLNRYLNASAFSQPAPFTFGDALRKLSNVRGPGNHDNEFLLFKNFAITEKVNVQFRAESFNVANHTNLGLPVADLNSPSFGQILSAGSPRLMQFALKLTY